MSKISNTKWQMVYQDHNIVTIDPEKEKIIPHGDPRAYEHHSIPEINDPEWEDAPTIVSDGKELLNFVKSSKLKSRYKAGDSGPSIPVTKLHFTYFRTFVNIPEKGKINAFNVVINKVDDGARVYLINRKFPKGKHVSKGAKLHGKVESNNFSQDATEGQNLIVIVQFDDCGNDNKLTGGIDILINGEKIETNKELPIPSTIYKLVMSTVPVINPSNPKEATGDIGGIKYTYTSSEKVHVEKDHAVYGFTKFPKDENIPTDQKSIRNEIASNNTITFEREISDPVLVFSSIGSSYKEVAITFYNDTEIIYQEGLTHTSAKEIKGKEGYAVLKISGKHKEIKFDYEQDEQYVNFLFGASI